MTSTAEDLTLADFHGGDSPDLFEECHEFRGMIADLEQRAISNGCAAYHLAFLAGMIKRVTGLFNQLVTRRPFFDWELFRCGWNVTGFGAMVYS